MPLVRVDFAPAERAPIANAVGDVVHGAMVEVLGVPKDDRFQVINEHPGEGLVFLNQGRDVDTKRAVAAGRHERVGSRVEDVFIKLGRGSQGELVVRPRRSPVCGAVRPART